MTPGTRTEDPLAIDPILRQVLDRAGEATAIYTAEERVIASTVVYANRALCDLSGYALEHFVGHSALLLAGARPDVATLETILPCGGAHEVRVRATKHRPDGSTYEVDVSVTPLRDRLGSVAFYLSTQRKVELKRSASAQALTRMRDASFSQLAAGIAYELEALTSTCLQGLAEARGLSARNGVELASIEAAQRAASSMAGMVRGLKAFTTEEPHPGGPVSVHEALELALCLAGPVVRERAMVERHYAPTPPVNGSLPRLARVFTQVLRNAGESIPPSMPEANHITVYTGQDPRGDVTVVIADTGLGIEPADLPFVGDPFFTTKTGSVTGGLGLAAARAEVTKLGGEIHIESAPGRGTRVRITLPPASGARVPANAPCLVTMRSPASRLLSVAETHAAALQVAQPFADGSVVVSLATWSEAVERLALAERYDLVLCDARDRGCEGFRERLRQVAPESSGRVLEVAVPGPKESGVFACGAGAPDAACGE